MHLWAPSPWGLGIRSIPWGHACVAISSGVVPLHISTAWDQRPSPLRWTLTGLHLYQGLHLYLKQLHKEKIRESTKPVHARTSQLLLTSSIVFTIVGSRVLICLLPYPNWTGKAMGARILSVWFAPVPVPCTELGP